MELQNLAAVFPRSHGYEQWEVVVKDIFADFQSLCCLHCQATPTFIYGDGSESLKEDEVVTVLRIQGACIG